jgi:two-component system NarL family sensor kinase
VAYILIFAALVVSVAALVVRFARSKGEERLQLKWFAAAAVLVLMTFAVTLPASLAIANAASSLAGLCLFAAVAIAVLKYRLYDIDLVISKAVLYRPARRDVPEDLNSHRTRTDDIQNHN